MKAEFLTALALAAAAFAPACSSADKAPEETDAVADAAPVDTRLPEVRYYVIADT